MSAIITGRYVTLELLAQTHAPHVFKAVCNADAFERVAFMVDPPPQDSAAQADWFTRKVSWPGRAYYACVDQVTGQANGFLAYMRDEADHRTVEIGDVLFGAGLQRTPAASEAVYLLLRNAFEAMNYRRVEWKCDTRNAASYRAAERFGFTFEGVFRQHMIIRGQSRDSAWFSMLDHEWPARRIAFDRWLSPENFDASGAQRTPLASFIRA
ncbi:MAG: GNAT family N-acetyltransferase [Beijerinckiaceae bacterium]|nr:GNAT family N-acetyltransferase [Beijerinckiaceae bacterium]